MLFNNKFASGCKIWFWQGENAVLKKKKSTIFPFKSTEKMWPTAIIKPYCILKISQLHMLRSNWFQTERLRKKKMFSRHAFLLNNITLEMYKFKPLQCDITSLCQWNLFWMLSFALVLLPIKYAVLISYPKSSGMLSCSSLYFKLFWKVF